MPSAVPRSAFLGGGVITDTGYVTDIDYPDYFHSQMSPLLLSSLCRLAGFDAVRPEPGFTYLELGAGAGMTTAVLAAANPEGRFVGTDFNPRHIAAGTQMIRAAGLTNASFLECGFADLAEGKVALPAFDYVALSGVYSWVDAEQREHVLTILDRHVKPGGVVYINYNAMPGWAVSAPLQRLILEYSEALDGGVLHRLSATREWVDRLVHADGRFFSSHEAALRPRLDSFGQWADGYVAHEFINRGWQALFHTDVARAVAGAGLEFAGSVSPVRPLRRTPEQRKLFEGITDRALREVVADFLDDTQFREDVYVRQPRRLSPRERGEWCDEVGLCLTERRGAMHLHTVSSRLLNPLLDALEQRPMTFTEIAQVPAFSGLSMAAVVAFGERLTAEGWTSPYLRSAQANSAEPAWRLNRVLAERAQTAAPQSAHYALASPVISSGVPLNFIQAQVYLALTGDDPGLGADTVERVLARLHDCDIQVEISGNAVKRSSEVTRAEAVDILHAIRDSRVPVWRRLRVLAGE
ncbi:Methyltransferase domain-containing protein [Sinosporangium album]|uniref:Methyltransferase domain-containing protein n=1 Tax=Sinosporangium album TaxID=504805 RepID=A0A1G8B4T3_9ACTN|nr:Methyltransferase domain-containing protein [Sinosporangium album]